MNASTLLTDDTTIPRHAAFRISSVMRKSYFTTSFARCHIEIMCQHNHCNISHYDFSMKRHFTVPHLFILYTWTITSVCYMHTLTLTASRSVVVDTDIHSVDT